MIQELSNQCDCLISVYLNLIKSSVIKLNVEEGELKMFRCARCMKKIPQDQSLSAINVKFAERVNFKDKEGEIIQVYLNSRKTSVPMIVTTADSEAKEHGTDGLFTVCSEKCGEKMKTALSKEIDTFRHYSDPELQ